jgi:hypothetical protein
MDFGFEAEADGCKLLAARGGEVTSPSRNKMGTPGISWGAR